MEASLERVIPGMEAVVTGLDGCDRLNSRLHSFGMCPGTKVRVCYTSPDGGVTALRLRSTVIALRTRELCKIRVRLV